MAEGSSATPANASPMPVALAPWVMTWKPEGVAGLLTRNPTVARARKTRGKGTRCRCLTVFLHQLFAGGRQRRSGGFARFVGQASPRRGEKSKVLGGSGP